MKKITLLFALLSIMFANAQWTTDTAENTLVASSNPFGAESVGTSDGKTYVVFWKGVEAPTNFELRAQLIDADGNQMFGPDGMLISNTIPMGTYTVVSTITVDTKNNLYIGVTGTSGGNPCMIYKINPDGQFLWNGVNVGDGFMPKIKPLANDDVIVTYWKAGKGKITRLNPQGDEIWDTPVEILPSASYASNATVAGDIFEHSNGEFTVIFHTRLSYSIPSLLFAQRYTGTGTALWAEPAQLANVQTAYNNQFYSGVQDGDVIYYGFSGAHDNRFDAYVQRINADGTTPWGINGKDFDINQANFEKDVKIAFEAGSDYIWAISLYTNTSQDQAGEYIQKFDKETGERLFTENAKQVFAITQNATVHAPSSKLYLLNDNPYFTAKTGYDNGANPIVLNAVFLDGNGDFILESQVLPIATFAATKDNVYQNAMLNGQAVIMFTEEKTAEDKKIYVQNFMLPTELCAVTLTLQNLTKEINEDGSIALTGLEFDNGSTDSCGSTAEWTWTVTPETFSCENIGEQTVTVTATNANGSSATATAAVTITDPNNYCGTAGINDAAQNDFSLYPNPATDSFTITGTSMIKSVTVYDMLGKIIVSQVGNTVDVRSWAKGVYAVTIETNNGEIQKLKVVKQ